MEKLQNLLCYGSLLSLRTLDNYHHISEGFIDTYPYLKQSITSEFSSSVFRIIPSSISSSQEELRFFVQEMQKNNLSNNFQHLEKLENKLDGEIKNNIQIYNYLKGKPIQYDSLVQLVHVRSQKYLTVKSNTATDLERENLKVLLEEDSSSCSHFVVSRGYNY
jgi:hypothetical protein